MQRTLISAGLLMLGAVLNAQTTIYNSIPSPLPPSLPSRSFEAGLISEYGNAVMFSGSPLTLNSVTLVMVTGAYPSKYPGFYTMYPAAWPQTITLNLYNADSSSPPNPVRPPFKSVTQTFQIPWRPNPDPSCTDPTRNWLAPDGLCHYGMAFRITFNFGNLPVPPQLIFGIAYNTQDAGQTPTGVNGPYNDLNVSVNGVPSLPPSVGTNPSFPMDYLNSSITGGYDDMMAPAGVFRLDTASSDGNIAIQFNPPPTSITVTGNSGTQSAAVGTAFGTPLQALVTDANNYPLSGVVVAFSPPASGPSATLSPTPVVVTGSSGVPGVASVTATANATLGAYTVTASVAGVTTPATFNLTNTAGAPANIRFVQQPTSTPAGQPIPDITVSVADASMNPINGAQVTLMLYGGTGTLNGYTPQNTVNGIATFHSLSINTAGPYTLQAATVGLPPVTSNTFNIIPAAPMISVFQGSGQSAIVGAPYSGALKALVADQYGNVISGAQVTFTAPSSGPSVTFATTPATVTTDSTGIATSPTLAANSQAGTVTVNATTAGASAPAVFMLTNLAGPANRLSFLQQPNNTVAGQDITPPVTVQLQDSSGNPVQTAGVPITVQSNTVLQQKHLFSGNSTQNTNANGLATFSNLSIALAGTYQLLASGPNVASATSNPFTVTAGAASIISATGGDSQSAFVQTVFAVPLQATVTDAAGNPISGIQVTFTAPSTGPSGTLGGQLTDTVPTDLQGHASAVIMANNIPGNYSVTAIATMSSGSASFSVSGSASFSLTNLPLASTVLKFVQQPSNAQAGQVIAPPVTVQVQNSSGSPSNTAGVPIVMSLSSGSGSLLGTIVQSTDATGTATFNDLRISSPGSKQLTATSPSQPPVLSNTFQISGGTPATISAISGTPQSTTVSTLFPMLLQARVADALGNPVSGANVTFTAPASGPSGTFASSPTATTDVNGNAFAPLLTANSTVGSFAVTASAPGTGLAAFSLTNLPQAGSLVAAPSQLSFFSQINQPAPPGQSIQVTSTGGALSWTVSTSAAWIAVNPTTGTTPGTATISVNPMSMSAGTYSGSAVFTSSNGGTTAVLITYTIGAKPALVVSPSTLVFTTPSTTLTPPAQTLAATSSGGTISYGVTTQVATPTGGTWLKASPGSGQTAGSAQVSVNLTGLGQGIYNGTVLFTPADSSINTVAVPVSLLVACGQGGCTGLPATILSVVNGASFHPGGAPRAVMTIFGTNLADSVYQARTYPLPTQLGPTSVTVNGSAVPLYYVSPTQINFQMPSNAPATNVQVGVNNGFTQARIAQDQTTNLRAVDPGLFVNVGNRAAALNGDLSPHTAATPQPAGATIVLYTTGGGPISPPLPDGTAAPSSPLSSLAGNVQVSIGGQSAQVSYSGVAPGFAGLSQINAIIPSGLAPGDQPVFVTVNGVSSNAGLITVK